MSEQLSTAAETIEELKEAFTFLEEWTDRYGYLIDLGRKLPEFPEALKVDENLMQGCQSQVWLISHMNGEKIEFLATSDAMIVSGLIGLLLSVYSNRTPAEILATDPAFLEELGLNQHLSPSRSNGLHSMVKHIMAAAKTKAAE
ncbi:MAG: SufE family protein [Sneathiella sp.]